MNKEEATKLQKFKAYVFGMLVVDAQTIAAAWILMLMVGMVHHNFLSALQPASFLSCVLILFGAQILYILHKFTIDFR